MKNEPVAQDLKVQITNRQILKIALPISLAIFVPQINFITNNIFLGSIGESSLAAAAITGVGYLIFSVIGVGFNNALQALISRRAGENRLQDIGILFGHSIRISLGLSALGIFAIYFIVPPVLRATLHSTDLVDQINGFLKIRIWGLPFLYIYQMVNALLVGTNQSKFLIIGATAETVANIFFDYGLIYGKFGLPAVGFDGAAIASIVAEFIGMVVVLLVVYYMGVGKRFSLFEKFEVRRSTFALILKQSYPLVLQYAASIVTWQFFYILVEHHGQRSLAISNTMRNVFGLFGICTWAFAATTNTMVSNIIGQGRKDKVIFLIKKITLLSVTASVIFCTIINLIPEVILSVFGQPAGFLEEAKPVIRVVSSALILMSFGSVWLNGVTGTGNSRVNLAIELITLLFYSVYVYLTLEVYRLPIYIGWMSEWLYWTFLFTLSFFYLRSGRWKKLNL
ncbi:MAG: MATE family efflux transporter [Chitinophagaceae bacterium]